jgi:methionyl-tRNA formyltransferase
MRGADLAVGLMSGPHAVEGAAFGARVPRVWLRHQDEREVNRLAWFKPDLLLVGNFALILKRPILEVPKIGVVNVHWSLLPHHRGPNPGTSVLLDGDPVTGVTFHVVDERIDAGDILHQVSFPLDDASTAASIYARAVGEAGRAVAAVLAQIETDGLVGRPQDLSAGSYRRRLTRDDARLDFSRPAFDLARQVRALVQPMAWTTFRGHPLYISTARWEPGAFGAPGTIVRLQPNVWVACGDGALVLQRVWSLRPPSPWPAPWTRVQEGEILGQ